MNKSFYAATAALLISAGAGHATTIGVSMAKLNTFQTALRDSIVSSAQAMPGVTVKVEQADGKSDVQMEQIKKHIAAKVDALIVGPVDGDMGPQISKLAADAGIPLVYVNNFPSNLADLPEKQALVASDEKDSGTIQTKEVCRLLNGKGKVVVLMGELFHAAARKRTEDINDVLATDACKGLEIVERQAANWSRPNGDAQMQEWLSAGVTFDAVIANNDDMALGAIDAMKREGLPMKSVVVAGVDATAAALKSIADGDLDLTILQNAVGQGAGAVQAAIKLTKGDKVEKINFVPFELVTPENLQKYQPKSQ